MRFFKSKLKPLTEKELLVLKHLEHNTSYGWSLVTHLKSKGVIVTFGTIYGYLDKLVKQGFVEAFVESDSKLQKDIKLYSITLKGREYLSKID